MAIDMQKADGDILYAEEWNANSRWLSGFLSNSIELAHRGIVPWNHYQTLTRQSDIPDTSNISIDTFEDETAITMSANVEHSRTQSGLATDKVTSCVVLKDTAASTSMATAGDTLVKIAQDQWISQQFTDTAAGETNIGVIKVLLGNEVDDVYYPGSISQPGIVVEVRDDSSGDPGTTIKGWGIARRSEIGTRDPSDTDGFIEIYLHKQAQVSASTTYHMVLRPFGRIFGRIGTNYDSYIHSQYDLYDSGAGYTGPADGFQKSTDEGGSWANVTGDNQDSLVNYRFEFDGYSTSGTNTCITDTITAGATITNAYLLPLYEASNTGDALAFTISADNGSNYESPTIGQWHEFSNTGTELKVKGTFTSTTATTSPVWDSYAIMWLE